MPATPYVDFELAIEAAEPPAAAYQVRGRYAGPGVLCRAG